MAEYLLYSQEPLEEGEFYGSTRPWRNALEEGEWAAAALKETYLSPRRDEDIENRLDKIVGYHNQMVSTNKYDPPCPSSSASFDDYTGAPLDPHLNKSLFGDEDGEPEGKGLYSFIPRRVIKGDMFSCFNQDGKLIPRPKKGEAFYLEADFPVYIQTLFTTNSGYVHVLPDWSKIYMKITRRNFDVSSVSMSCIDTWRPSTEAAYELAVAAECTSWLLPTPSLQRIASLPVDLAVSKLSVGKVAVISFSRPLNKVKDYALFKSIDTSNTSKASGAQPIQEGQQRVLASITTSYTGCVTAVSGGNYTNGTAEACAASVIDAQVKGKYYKIFSPEFSVGLKHKRVEFLELFPSELVGHAEEFIDVKCHNFFLLKMKKPVGEYQIRSMCLNKEGVTIKCVSEQEYYSSRNDSACLTKPPCHKKRRVNIPLVLVVTTNDEQGFMDRFNAAVEGRLPVHGKTYTNGVIRILFSSIGHKAKCREANTAITKLVEEYNGVINPINASSDFTAQLQALGDGIKPVSLYDSASDAPHTCDRSITHCRYTAVCTDKECVLGGRMKSSPTASGIGGEESEDVIEAYAMRIGDYHAPQRKSSENASVEGSLALPGVESACVRLLRERELLAKHASGFDKHSPFLEDSVPGDRYGYISPCVNTVIAAQENYGRDEERIKVAQTAGVEAMLARHTHRGSVWMDSKPATGAIDGSSTGILTVEEMLGKMFG